MLPHAKAICAKSIGENNLATGLDIGLGHCLDLFRVGQVPGVRKIPQAQASRLELGTPGPVCQNRPLGQHFLQERMHAVRPGQAAVSAATAFFASATAPTAFSL